MALVFSCSTISTTKRARLFCSNHPSISPGKVIDVVLSTSMNLLLMSLLLIDSTVHKHYILLPTTQVRQTPSWVEERQDHSGIILRFQNYSIGAQMRRILKIIATKSAEEMY